MFFKKTPNLDNIVIAAPCPIEWSEMKGDDRVRFCSYCSLNVYNISAMSKKEAEGFLEGQTGRSCLRFFRRTDGTIITNDCPLGRRVADGIKRKARAAAAIFLAVFNGSSAFAQNSDQAKQVCDTSTDTKQTHTQFQMPPTVLDERGGAWGSRAERVQKVSPTLPEGVPIPDTNEVVSNRPLLANSDAMNAFNQAHICERNNDDSGASIWYQQAIDTFRTATIRFDKQFILKVVRAYAANLRKTKQSAKALELEKEFINEWSGDLQANLLDTASSSAPNEEPARTIKNTESVVVPEIKK